MAYATLQDLQTRFGEAELVERTDRAGGQVIDAAVAQRALDDASAEIDGYLSVRYAVPVSPAPALLVTLCCDIARYRLHQPVAAEGIRSAYQDAVRSLRDIADGRAALAGAALPTASTLGGPVRSDAPARELSRDALRDFTDGAA